MQGCLDTRWLAEQVPSARLARQSRDLHVVKGICGIGDRLRHLEDAGQVIDRAHILHLDQQEQLVVVDTRSHTHLEAASLREKVLDFAEDDAYIFAAWHADELAAGHRHLRKIQVHIRDVHVHIRGVHVRHHDRRTPELTEQLRIFFGPFGHDTPREDTLQRAFRVKNVCKVLQDAVLVLRSVAVEHHAIMKPVVDTPLNIDPCQALARPHAR
mmetsp:Transcript_64561/g.185641  ORF Transcript_64561/g.185641 Transcript_64561/m.185641 type:complete len:213 (+) Transcript_64561:103-741(+)